MDKSKVERFLAHPVYVQQITAIDDQNTQYT